MAKMIQLTRARKTPFFAALSAPLKSFSPRFLERSALIPTPVPAAIAIIRDWIGNARDTAVSASSLSLSLIHI